MSYKDNAQEVATMICNGDLGGLMGVLREVAEDQPNRVRFDAPESVAALLLYEMSALQQEHFRVAILDSRNGVIEIVELYKGTLNSNMVRIAEVFRDAIIKNAAAIIVVHNHPSGDPSPSPEDVGVTAEIADAGRLLGIQLLDHIIIGKGRFVSLKARGLGF
jgi:DNA repair protein RadC